MPLFKFSVCLILVVFMNFSYAYRPFDDNDCLNASFDAKIARPVKYLTFLKHNIVISKKKCVMEMAYKKFGLMGTSWLIDVCRQPVHFKKSANEVILKTTDCQKKNDNSLYCQSLGKINHLLLNEALVHAPGEKENLLTPHGKFYCAYLLYSKYLVEGMVFSRSQKYSGVITPGPNIEEVTESKASSEKKQDQKIPTNDASDGVFIQEI